MSESVRHVPAPKHALNPMGPFHRGVQRPASCQVPHELGEWGGVINPALQ